MAGSLSSQEAQAKHAFVTQLPSAAHLTTDGLLTMSLLLLPPGPQKPAQHHSTVRSTLQMASLPRQPPGLQTHVPKALTLKFQLVWMAKGSEIVTPSLVTLAIWNLLVVCLSL